VLKKKTGRKSRGSEHSIARNATVRQGRRRVARETAGNRIQPLIREPELTGREDVSHLRLSVITSSNSDMPISELVEELWLLRTHAIDFYPRGRDIQAAMNITRPKLESLPLLDRFTDASFHTDIARYVKGELREGLQRIRRHFGVKVSTKQLVVPALATFFPEIGSFDDELAKKAGKALANSVRLAKKLQATVVEFVLGRTVERCHRSPAGAGEGGILRCEYIHRGTAESRIVRAVDILAEYVIPLAEQTGVRLAAEIEPGFSYVLSSRTAVEFYLQEIRKRKLDRWLGLNADIGHLLILQGSNRPGVPITPDIARTWTPHIFHAHGSDNVGQHYRDLVPGTFHSINSGDGERFFWEWVELLQACVGNGSFSGFLAVELEACSRIQWLQRSLLRLGYLVRQIAARK